MATRTGAQAVAYARTITHWPVGYCLKFVRTCFNVASKYPSAIIAWNNAKYRHGPTSAVPVGVPVFWSGGRYGHVAISVGNGRCRSTDYPRSGVVSEVAIADLSKAWGYRYLGWTEDLNGVRVYNPTVAPKIVPLASSTLVSKTGWQVSDLKYVLVKAGFGPISDRTDFYGAECQKAVIRFHTSTLGKPFSSAPYAQIGPNGWKALQAKIGRK